MTQKIIVNNFVHRVGVHCESSAMRDLFEFYGFKMSEAMAFGLDATLGFGFFDTTESVSFIPKSKIPFFLGGKQGTIDPNSLACRLLGISLRKQSFTSADKAWEESKKLINQNIPLILKVDLGYLPYFEEEGDIHFGGHAITLCGYDEEREIAFVGDTDFIDFQDITIDKLKRARSSEYEPSFMRPNNAQYSMMRRSDGKRPPFASGIKVAIQKVTNNMLRPSINNNGIQGLNQFANSIPLWKDKLKGEAKDVQGKSTSLARLTFDLLYGYIETWGTGGAIFRNLYKEFLEELLVRQELKEGPKAWITDDFFNLEESIKLIADSVKNWTLFSETLKTSIKDYKDDCLNYVDLKFLHGIAVNILIIEEKLFKTLLKIKL